MDKEDIKEDIKVKKGSRVFKLNSKKLVEAIWQNYQLRLRPYLEVIKAGNVNLHLIGKDKQKKRHIIRIYREDKEKKQVDYELKLVNFLCSKNFPTPKVYKTQADNLYIKYDNYFVALFEFIDGDNPPYTSEVLYQIGRGLANFHNLSEDQEFKRSKILQRKGDLYRNGQRNKDIYQLLSENAEKLQKECSKVVFNISRTILKKISDLDFSDCKEGLIHSDAVFHNLIFSKDQKVYFLDFDDTGLDPFILDFTLPIVYSCAVNAWNYKELDPEADSYEVKILPNLLEAYLKGYNTKRSLRELELEKLKGACIFRIFDFEAWRFWHTVFAGQNKENHILKDWEIYEHLNKYFDQDIQPIFDKLEALKIK